MSQPATRNITALRMLSTSVDDLKSSLACQAANRSPHWMLATCQHLFDAVSGMPSEASKRKAIADAARKAIKVLETAGPAAPAKLQDDLDAEAEEARNTFGGCS